jgi:DNA-binding NarL/FixJ family response regulator
MASAWHIKPLNHNNPPMIRVSIVEDHRATRESLVKLLQHAPEMVCVGAYGNAEQAEVEIPLHVPDVVLMDINLAGASGIDCVEKLKQSHPQIEFMMVTTYDDTELIFNALRAGASGYILKRTAPDELLAAIREVRGGGSPMSMEIARRVVSHFHEIRKPMTDEEPLSGREREILNLLTEGLAYKQIADRLGISPHTVHNHLRRIYGKLHVQSRTEAVVKFMGSFSSGKTKES